MEATAGPAVVVKVIASEGRKLSESLYTKVLKHMHNIVFFFHISELKNLKQHV